MRDVRAEAADGDEDETVGSGVGDERECGHGRPCADTPAGDTAAAGARPGQRRCVRSGSARLAAQSKVQIRAQATAQGATGSPPGGRPVWQGRPGRPGRPGRASRRISTTRLEAATDQEWRGAAVKDCSVSGPFAAGTALGWDAVGCPCPLRVARPLGLLLRPAEVLLRPASVLLGPAEAVCRPSLTATPSGEAIPDACPAAR